MSLLDGTDTRLPGLDGSRRAGGARQVIALAVRESALASRSADNVPYAYTDQESRESVDVP